MRQEVILHWRKTAVRVQLSTFKKYRLRDCFFFDNFKRGEYYNLLWKLPLDKPCFFIRPHLLKILSLDVVFGLHASGFKMGKKGYLFIGPGSSGKTTILKTAYKQGYKLIGDEIVLFGGKKNIYFFPFLAIIYDKGKIIKPKKEAFLKKTKVNRLFFPRIARYKKSRISPLEKKQVLKKLLQNSLWIPDKKSSRRQFEFLAEISKINSFKLYLGKDHKKNPELIFDLIKNA